MAQSLWEGAHQGSWRHILECNRLDPLVLIEVQTGDYLEKEGIVRLADDFWLGVVDASIKGR